jgi:hypothetical protein
MFHMDRLAWISPHYSSILGKYNKTLNRHKDPMLETLLKFFRLKDHVASKIGFASVIKRNILLTAVK